MSAYLVSPIHLDVIVSYFATVTRQSDQLWCTINGQYTYLDKTNAEHLAYILWRENVRSVNNRYQEHNSDETYVFTSYPYIRDLYKAEEIACALDCLEYQSCEREDYHQSEAWNNICMMRKHLLRELAEQELGDNTPWEISELKQEVSA